MPSKKGSKAKGQDEDMSKKLLEQECTLAAMQEQMKDENSKQREALNDLQERMNQLMQMLSSNAAQQQTKAVPQSPVTTVNLEDETEEIIQKMLINRQAQEDR